MKTMKKMLSFWLVAVMSLSLGCLASCGSDKENKGASGTSGSGGTAGSGGSSGEPSNAWQTGKIGSTDRVKTIMENGGAVLAIDVQQNVKPLMKTMDWDPDGGLPPTIPTVDFSEAMPNSVLVMEVPPYLHQDTLEPAYPPYTVYIHPDGTVDAVQHYQDWTNELTTACYGTFPVTINGVPLQAFSGMIWDVASGLNRHFITTNANDCVYEVYPTGEMNILSCGIEGPSSLGMHPMGYLMVTTLPGFTKNAFQELPVQPVKLYKLTVETKELTEIATMPVPDDYRTKQAFCDEFPYTEYSLPTTMRNAVSIFSDGSFAVTDAGAGRIYKVSPDGSKIDEYANVPFYVAGITIAPNDVVYGIFPPLLGFKDDGQGTRIIKGATLYAWDTDTETWVLINELPGYVGTDARLSAQNSAVPCPEEFESQNYDHCLAPTGLFMKLVPGQTPTNPYIMISDPITTRIFQVILKYGTEPEPGDAGTGGQAGAGGAGGEGGSSGTAGSAGASGYAGAAGSSGNGGSSGSAGIAGSSGSSGSGGASGSAGSAGNP
jgi:hypothetical protein